MALASFLTFRQWYSRGCPICLQQRQTAWVFHYATEWRHACC